MRNEAVAGWQCRSGGSTGAQKKKSAQKVAAEKKAKRDPGTYPSKLEKLGSTLLVKLNRQKRLKRKPSRNKTRNKWKHEERKRDKNREKERDERKEIWCGLLLRRHHARNMYMRLHPALSCRKYRMSRRKGTSLDGSDPCTR